MKRKNQIFIVTFFLGLFWVNTASAYQRLSGYLSYDSKWFPTTALTMNPSYKEFTFYVSDTYADPLAYGAQKPITEIHIAAAKRALEILEKRAEVDGLKFTYGGTFTSNEAFKNEWNQKTDFFDKKIYYDFSGAYFDGDFGNIFGFGHGQQTASSGDFSGGISVHINSKMRNIIHPRESLITVLIHETLHGFGLGHSTNAASLLSYGYVRANTISQDDVLGLKQIFGSKTDTTHFSVETSLDGTSSAGVEVILIDKITGRSFTVLTEPNGKADTYGIPPGDYIVVGREFSEAASGPCFLGAQHGFLSSFYISDSATSNLPTDATPVTLVKGNETAIKLPLTAGERKYDCFASGSTRQVSTRQGQTISDVDAWREYFRPGIYANFLIATDKFFIDNELSSKVRTNPPEGIHSRVVVSNMGSAPAFELDSFQKYRDDGTIALAAQVYPNAPLGSYPLLCEADGQYTVANAAVEVAEHGGSANNDEMLPQFADKWNYNEKYIADPLPEDSSAKGRCGEISEASKNTIALWTALVFVFPLVLIQSFRRRKQRKKT